MRDSGRSNRVIYKIREWDGEIKDVVWTEMHSREDCSELINFNYWWIVKGSSEGSKVQTIHAMACITTREAESMTTIILANRSGTLYNENFIFNLLPLDEAKEVLMKGIQMVE